MRCIAEIKYSMECDKCGKQKYDEHPVKINHHFSISDSDIVLPKIGFYHINGFEPYENWQFCKDCWEEFSSDVNNVHYKIYKSLYGHDPREK